MNFARRLNRTSLGIGGRETAVMTNARRFAPRTSAAAETSLQMGSSSEEQLDRPISERAVARPYPGFIAITDTGAVREDWGARRVSALLSLFAQGQARSVCCRPAL